MCRELLASLTPLEPYWAYPGTPQFARVQRLFSAGSYDKFAHAVARSNRALTSEACRSRDILSFIRDLDTPEIHGCKPEFGFRVYTEKAIEMCQPAALPNTNGPSATTR